jgi:mono/diheme cytochrome c family protein
MTSNTASRATFGGLVVAIAIGTFSAPRAAEDPGERVYDGNCRRCHGPEGRGTTQAPSLIPFKWTYEEALELIRHPVCDMPPVQESAVSDAQVAQIVDYLKKIK